MKITKKYFFNDFEIIYRKIKLNTTKKTLFLTGFKSTPTRTKLITSATYCGVDLVCVNTTFQRSNFRNTTRAAGTTAVLNLPPATRHENHYLLCSMYVPRWMLARIQYAQQVTRRLTLKIIVTNNRSCLQDRTRIESEAIL